MAHSAGDGLVVRQAGHSDFKPLLLIIAEASPQSHDGQIRQLVEQALGESMALIASKSGEPIGCVLGQCKPCTVIHTLCVSPSERRRGHAQALISAAVIDPKFTEGSNSFWVAIDPNSPNAEKAFVANGFRAPHTDHVPGWGFRDLRLMYRKVERT